MPDYNLPSPSWLAETALYGYAEHLRRRSRSRSYVGPENAELRAKLRAWAAKAERMADGLHSGELVVDELFAGSNA